MLYIVCSQYDEYERKGVQKLDYQKVANKLIECRKSKGLTQEEVAKQIGITRSAVENYETARRIPRDEIKVRIASFYDTSVSSLFFTEE